MQNSKVTADMVRREYQRHISTYVRLIPDSALRLRVMLSADVYFRKCAVCVWGKSGSAGEVQLEAYNAICSKGSTPPSLLYFELMTMIGDRPAFEAPVFYDALLEYDSSYATKLAPQFRGLTETMLLLFAAVDDTVTDEESAFIHECMKWLADYQPGAGQKGPAAPNRNRPATDTSGPAQAQEAPKEPAEEETPAEPEETVEELLAQLDELCGLDKVKKDVHSMINLIKVRKLRKENGLPVPPMSLHLVFMGNPGTGKTTVARLIAKLYHAIGVIKKADLVEVDRGGLVAGYVGQTAMKTQEVINKAMGGVLFIDEAYSLTSQRGENDFGKEAIETLLKNMEDHRDELVVIVAGYADLMGEFISSNPGLESRFNKYFYFDDYTGEQLNSIFSTLCKKNGYTPDEEAGAYAPQFFNEMFETRDENFGNARDVRNIFESLIAVQSDRVSSIENPTVDDLMRFTLADFKTAAGDEDEETPAGEEAPKKDAPAEEAPTEETPSVDAPDTPPAE